MTVIISIIIHEAAAAQTCRSPLYTTLNQRVQGSSPCAPTIFPSVCDDERGGAGPTGRVRQAAPASLVISTGARSAEKSSRAGGPAAKADHDDEKARVKALPFETDLP